MLGVAQISELPNNHWALGTMDLAWKSQILGTKQSIELLDSWIEIGM